MDSKVLHSDVVFSWFKKLNGAKRLETMCTFLNMCFPLELRFLGTFLEDLGRRDYHDLKDVEWKCNAVSYITELTDISDVVDRSKLLVSIALLNSQNRECSKAVFKTLTEGTDTNRLALNGLLSDEKILNEILLLFTMVIYHPAFVFEQKAILAHKMSYFEEYLGNARPENQVKSCSIQINSDKSSNNVSSSLAPSEANGSSCKNFNYSHNYEAETSSVNSLPVPPLVHISQLIPMVTMTPSVIPTDTLKNKYFMKKRTSSSQEHHKITNIELRGIFKRKTYRIQVTWSNGKQEEVVKMHKELSNFHRRVQHLFPYSPSTDCDKYIPQFPNLTGNSNGKDLANEISNYLRNLVLHLPPHILESDLVSAFFQPSSNSFPPLVGRNASLNSFINSGTTGNVAWPLWTVCPPHSSLRIMPQGNSSSSTLQVSSTTTHLEQNG